MNMKPTVMLASLLLIVGCQSRMDARKPVIPADTSINADGPSTAAEHRATDLTAPLETPRNPADEDITATIRKQMLNTEMAPNLQNVMVTTKDGVVTLRGTVKTEEEKQKVEEIARTAVGAQSVKNWIETE